MAAPIQTEALIVDSAPRPVQGLTENEARARRQQGEGNDAGGSPSRSYWDIARTNLFSLFNNILFAIGITLIAMGRIKDALTSVGIGLFIMGISTVQEIQAKRKLQQISFVTRATVPVMRDGQVRDVDAAAVVKGDTLALRGGDQIVVDGVLLAGVVEVDESQLTGEPDLIRKQPGDDLFSGSFCVTGQGYYEAQKVGAASFVNRLAAKARHFEVRKTPLQHRVDLVVRVVMVVVAVFSILIFGAAVREGLPGVRLAQIAAVLSGQVPYGLFVTIAVAYAIAAATIARQGALAQQSNAIESLSSIDVLCMDKTGTLTANRLRFHALVPLGDAPATAAGAALGDLVRSASQGNTTSAAIQEHVDGQRRAIVDEVPFSSARKWSAVAFDDAERRGVYVLGAIEMLAPSLPPDALASEAPLVCQAQAWAAEGLRVLLVACQEAVTTLHNAAGQPALPPLTPLAVVSLHDELRPQVKETIAIFRTLGVELKVISGDNPQAVAALAIQAGLPPDLTLVAGPDLAAMDQAAFETASATATIFGRISPEQKEQVVDALRRRGKRVAMIGDGVNDVLALKKASVGIAMQSGSNATRNVADMILLNDSFAALPLALHEGQRVTGGIITTLYLFLARVATTFLIIVGVTMVGLRFPFDPAQLALTSFTVGTPAFFLTLWARPQPLRPTLLRDLARFVFPVAIVTMLMGVGLYVADYTVFLRGISQNAIPQQALLDFQDYTGLSLATANATTVAAAYATIAAQSSLSIFISCAAFLLIPLLEPPSRFFLGWCRDVSPDKRPALLAVGLFLVFQVIYFVEPIGLYFGIVTKPGWLYGTILGMVGGWFLLIRTIWRRRLVERLLGLDGEQVVAGTPRDGVERGAA